LGPGPRDPGFVETDDQNFSGTWVLGFMLSYHFETGVKALVGFIYGYKTCEGRWLYVGQTIDIKGRHKAHLDGLGHLSIILRLSRDSGRPLAGPIILEKVFGVDIKDLRFNLFWQETIWMLKLHTKRSCSGSGCNIAWPSILCCNSQGINGRKKNFNNMPAIARRLRAVIERRSRRRKQEVLARPSASEYWIEANKIAESLCTVTEKVPWWSPPTTLLNPNRGPVDV